MLLDDADTNSIKPTQFDLDRLSNLEVGEDFVGEKQNFKILRYKNDYVIILYNHTKKKDFIEVKDIEGVIKYLNE